MMSTATKDVTKEEFALEEILEKLKRNDSRLNPSDLTRDLPRDVTKAFFKVIDLKRYDIVKVFIAKTEGDEPFLDVMKNTGLHAAILNNDIEMMNLFLNDEKFNYCDIKNMYDEAPINLACILNNEAAVSLLIKKQEKSKKGFVSNANYEAALITAIKNKNYSNVNTLLKANTCCDKSDLEKGNIAIYEALANDDFEILELLLTKINILDVYNIHRQNVLDIASALNANNCLPLLSRTYSAQLQQREMQQRASEIKSQDPVEIRRTFLQELLKEIIKNEKTNWSSNGIIPLNVPVIEAIKPKLEKLDFSKDDQVVKLFDEVKRLLNGANYNSACYDIKFFFNKQKECLRQINEGEINREIVKTRHSLQTFQSLQTFPTMQTFHGSTNYLLTSQNLLTNQSLYSPCQTYTTTIIYPNGYLENVEATETANDSEMFIRTSHGDYVAELSYGYANNLNIVLNSNVILNSNNLNARNVTNVVSTNSPAADLVPVYKQRSSSTLFSPRPDAKAASEAKKPALETGTKKPAQETKTQNRPTAFGFTRL